MAHRGRKTVDDLLLTALACGATAEQAARAANVSLRTVRRRLNDPAFAAKLQEMRSDLLQRASGMLTAASLEAVKTLVSLQGTTMPPPVRLGAARAVLELGLRVRELAEVEGRLALLERQLTPSRN